MRPFRFFARKIMSARTDFAYWRFRQLRPDWERQLFDRLPPLEGELPGGTSDVVIFCGADRTYISRFALSFAVSLAGASDTAAFHLHMFGKPDEEIRTLAARLAAALGPSRFTMSHEDCDLTGKSRRRQIMYFEVVRFARLLEIARRIDTPLVSMDIDVLFLKKVRMLLDLCSGSDIAITLRPREFDPAKKVRAALIFFGATAGARSFLHRAVARMLTALFHGPEDEYPDQRCLARTIETTKGLKLKDLPPEVLSSESEDAIVFSGRGKVKDAVLPAVFARRFEQQSDSQSPPAGSPDSAS